jgi:thymidylate kinase
MPWVTCPRCGGKLDIGFSQLQQWMDCPRCRSPFNPLGDTASVTSVQEKKAGAPLAAAPVTSPANQHPSPADTKLVLAVEGPDGSGKTSLVRFLKDTSEQHGRGFTWISRRGVYASPEVNKLTRLLRDEAKQLTPHADFLIRLAREFQRAQYAALAPAGIVVLDRFVISVLALIRSTGQDSRPLMGLLQEITARARLHATIYVKCPVEMALGRVSTRNQELRKKETRNEPFLRKLAAFMEEDFRRGVLTGQQWLVDNSQNLTVAQEEVARRLLPYLQKT